MQSNKRVNEIELELSSQKKMKVSGLELLLSGIEQKTTSSHPPSQIISLLSSSSSSSSSPLLSPRSPSPSTLVDSDEEKSTASESPRRLKISDIIDKDKETTPIVNNNDSSPSQSYTPITFSNNDQIVIQPPSLPFSTTYSSLTFYYPCAAQKSYGSEKRFLCPPPVVSFTGKKLSISINVTDNDGPGAEHKATPDENNRASFKQIHVNSKAKVFKLKLNVLTERNIPASVETPPISIISKPSTKTTKSRNNSLGINSGDMICLFNRVNSQTVRTKYMGVEKKTFCAKGSSWSPFIIRLSTGEIGVPISYGSEVILIDSETGLSSDIWVIKKVVKNAVCNDICSVTQLQKIALHPKGKPDNFLSISPTSAYGVHNTSLCCIPPQSSDNSVQDYMCWTIVRIQTFTHKIDSKENNIIQNNNTSIINNLNNINNFSSTTHHFSGLPQILPNNNGNSFSSSSSPSSSPQSSSSRIILGMNNPQLPPSATTTPIHPSNFIGNMVSSYQQIPVRRLEKNDKFSSFNYSNIQSSTQLPPLMFHNTNNPNQKKSLS